MNADDVSDPSDWRTTSIPGLLPLDSNLRCLICKDFYTAPVITTCQHTFCSLCIRRSLSAESVCPTCRATNISDSGLRQNKVVEDLVENFLAVRGQLLALARKDETVEGTNDVREHPVEVEEDPVVIPALPLALPPPMATTRSTTRTQPDQMPCPICFKPFKSPEAIDLHIDSCRGPIFDPSPISQPPISSTRPHPHPTPSNGPREKSGPLPKLNYTLLKDRDLRNTLSNLGIPNYGSKLLMSARHKEYVNLYNANLDCKNPMQQPELLRRLDSWERTQIRGDAEGKKREIDGEEWEKRYQVDFTDLTRVARESAKRRKVEESEGGGDHVEEVQIAL